MDELKNSRQVLITGSNGFLGQKLTDMLVEKQQVQICCTSQGPNRNPNTKGYEFVQLDLSDTGGLTSLIDNFQPTHIVHTAAITSVEICEEEPEKCKKLNIDVVRTIAELCRSKDIHLTFLSTDFVFDGKNGPYDELSPSNPCNAYGQSKLMAEQAITGSGCRASILRTILVYGIIADKNRSNLVLWAKSKLEAGEPIKVVSDQWRMPTWVDDLAKACILSIEKNAKGIYHISSDKMFSIQEAVEEVAAFWNLDKTLITAIRAEEIGQAENRPQRTGFILKKAKEELGFQPTPFQESLAYIDQQFKYYRK